MDLEKQLVSDYVANALLGLDSLPHVDGRFEELPIYCWGYSLDDHFNTEMRKEVETKMLERLNNHGFSFVSSREKGGWNWIRFQQNKEFDGQVISML